MRTYLEQQPPVSLSAYEQLAVDILNGRKPVDYWPFSKNYKVGMGKTINRALNPEDVLMAKGLATCTGFGVKLTSQEQGENKFVLARVPPSLPPAGELWKMLRQFRDCGNPIDKIVISTQEQNVRSIRVASLLWHIINFSLKPEITLIDRREIDDLGGLLITTEGGVLLKGHLIDELEPGTPLSQAYEFDATKQWHWNVKKVNRL